MAYRAAAGWRAAGVVALGGDVPPELDRGALAGIPAALVGRGARDGGTRPRRGARDLRAARGGGRARASASNSTPGTSGPTPSARRWRVSRRVAGDRRSGRPRRPTRRRSPSCGGNSAPRSSRPTESARRVRRALRVVDGRRARAPGGRGARWSPRTAAGSSVRSGSTRSTSCPIRSASAAAHAYVSNLYVTPGARGGAGTRLLQAVVDRAAAEGVDRVVLWPSERSRTLYERFGFTTNGEVMERRCR